MTSTSQSYVFPADIWLLILRNVEYTTLKRLQRVSKTFQNLIMSETCDAALFRIPTTILVKPKQASQVCLHPILASLGSHLEMWRYQTAPFTVPLIATPQVSKRGSRKNWITRLLESSTADEAAFWPPMRGKACEEGHLPYGWSTDWSGMWMVYWQHFDDEKITYVTVRDVINLLMRGTMSLRTVKELGADWDCVDSSKLVRLRDGNNYWPIVFLQAEWKLVKDGLRRT